MMTTDWATLGGDWMERCEALQGELTRVTRENNQAIERMRIAEYRESELQRDIEALKQRAEKAERALAETQQRLENVRYSLKMAKEALMERDKQILMLTRGPEYVEAWKAEGQRVDREWRARRGKQPEVPPDA